MLRRLLFVVMGIAFAVAVRPAPAESEPGRQFDPNSLEAMLLRIHDHVASDDWRKEDFSDKTLETWLDKLIVELAKSTGDKDLALPVRFADVKPAAAVARPQKVLLFTKGGNIGHVQDSVILCDGNLKVSFAFNSVIIARGPVEVAHARESVVISGSFVHVSHCDNGPRAAAAGGAPRRSIILSRGMVDLGFANSCVLFAPLGIECSHASGCSFINQAAPAARGVPDSKANVRVVMAGPPLETMRQHPLGKQVEFVGVLDSDEGAVVRFDGKRYVVEKDAEILDESGKPVEKLAGWKLAFVNSSVLILGRGDFDTAIVSRRKR